MGRSRRLAVDDSNSWLLRADYLNDPDGTIDHGDADYILFALDGSGDEDFTVEPGLYGNRTSAFLAFVVWGKGVVSFGPPTAEQIAFMAAADAATDLSQFPGAFVHAGYTDPAQTSIFVGIRNPETLAGPDEYTVVKFGESTITIYGDRITFSNGAGVVDLGTGVRLTPGDAVNGAYRLTSLITVTGTSADNVIEGTSAPQTLRGLGGQDTITAGDGATDIYGDAGNDRITGSIGKDRLYGGDGNDTIKGTSGDTVDGGAGNDLLIAERGMTIAGGSGIDRLHLDFTGLGLRFNVTLPDGPDAVITSISTSYTGIERFDLSGGYNNDRLFGNSQANKIDGGPGADVINGGAGSDTIDAGIGGPAPEQPVEELSSDFATAIAIDTAFSAVPGASPQALIAFPEQAFIESEYFYSFDVLEGGDLLVEGDKSLPYSAGYGLTLFDAGFNLIADNFGGFPLEVNDLAAGRYVLRITSKSDDGFTKTGYFDVNLSTAMTPQRRNVLAGGTGDDTFLVHAANDLVTEKEGEGTDTVIADLSWTLAVNLEKLVLKAGAGAINGAGNALANTITGNESANILNGGNGADTLIGGAGSDLLRGDGGADRMEGGTGNDAYRVDVAGDLVIEKIGEGIDKVFSSVSLKLAANVENLILTGANALNGKGNALANQITGNSGANVLDGGTGVDVMLGGGGDDTYYVDNRSDRVYETVTARSPLDAGGSDTVFSSAPYSLAAAGRVFIENLTLTGNTSIDATGNDLGNRLSGNNGANTLVGRGGDDTLVGYNGDDRLAGGAGNDVLISGAGNDRIDPGSGRDAMTGGTGADTFVFSNETVSDALTMAAADRISDFSHAERDRIDLRAVDANLLMAGDQAFTFIGTSAFTRRAGELRIESTSTATFIAGDLNGDGVADGYIRLAGGLALVAGDFLL